MALHSRVRHSVCRLFSLCFLWPIATGTTWEQISPLLAADFSEALPSIPASRAALELYERVLVGKGYPFGTYQISMGDAASINNDTAVAVAEASLCNDSVAPVVAGPVFTCTADTCSGPGLEEGSKVCRSSFHSTASSIQLGGRIGTFWAPALASPSWAQFTFPAVPSGAGNVTLRFTLDSRYRPELYGGNSCPNASQYNCSLCTRGAWDFAVAAGVHVLWSAAGRDAYHITPVDGLGEAFDAGEMTQILQPPGDLNLQVGEYPVISFLVFNQYPAFGEVTRDEHGRCSLAWSDQGVHSFKDKPLMIVSAELVYRQPLQITQEPPNLHPRLYGSNSDWFSQRVEPFFQAACEIGAEHNVGWFGGSGVADVKAHFETSARGFTSCYEASKDGGDISTYGPAGKYLEFVEQLPSYTDGLKVMHLVRRLWSCAAKSGSFASCEYNETETERLAMALVAVDLQRFNRTTWYCGVSCGGGAGEVLFDLTTSEPVNYFSTWYDLLVSRTDLLSEVDAARVAASLKEQMGLFMSNFNTGHWNLWNGNNWTPHLCIAAMSWLVTFWYEEATIAREVLAMVNDILWLHRNMFTSDGVYVEGVAMYSFMSITGLVGISAMQRASFGLAPEAVDANALASLVEYHLASMSTDGYTVPFGDSHKKRGWGDFSTLQAAVAAEIVGRPVESVPLSACGAREYSAALYGSGGLYEDPWRISPELLTLNLTSLVTACASVATQPLGGAVQRVFSEGGYVSMQIPLLAPGDTFPCFGSDASELCVNSKPSLADNIPYSFLALQARPNSYSHSEVDFGTFTWSAWGTRLLSEYGYGTIATAVGQWDFRRYEYIDNNPAGHNTVVVREAFKDGDTINFSQLHWAVGRVATAEITTDAPWQCVELDGSAPYGSQRTDGWLDVMRRYACPVADGAFVLMDVLQVKRDRSTMNLYGAQYGGPNFNEAEPASQELHLEEYFHTETSAPLKEADGNFLPEELPFDRSSSKWCSHVDPILQDGSDSVLLQPHCGLGDYRPADGLGLITGFSLAGGSFIVDGLVTTVDRWFRSHWLKKRRFRFVGTSPVTPEGDVRVFVLSPSVNSTTVPKVALSSCSSDFGCGQATALNCSCVAMCWDSTLRWAVVHESRLRGLKIVGSCDGTTSLDQTAVSLLQAGVISISTSTDAGSVATSASSTSSTSSTSNTSSRWSTSSMTTSTSALDLTANIQSLAKRYPLLYILWFLSSAITWF